MRAISRFVSTTGGYLVCLAFLILLLVGVGPETLPFSVRAQYSDAAISHWPNAFYLQQSMHDGTIPLWRDLLMSGQPFAANPLNKIWYPPQWLALLLPAALHLNLLIWLHLVLAGFGMRMLGLRLGLRIEIANITGLAYALAPRLWVATGAGHLDILYASAWIPWVQWAIHSAVAENVSVGRRVALLGVIGALTFLADIRTSLFGLGIGAAYAVWLLLASRFTPSRTQVKGMRGGVALVLIGGALLALGLTAVQWLPLSQLMPYVSRNGLTSAEAGVYSLDRAHLIGLIVPERFGFQETLTYTGIIILILAIVALIRAPRQRLFWMIVIALGVLYALGSNGPLWPVLVRIFPPLLWLRVPSRVWIVVVVSIIVLSGYGLEALTDPRVQRLYLPLFGIVLTAVAIGWGIIASRLTLPEGAGIVPLLGFLALGGLFLAIRRIPQSAIVPIIAVLVVVDLIWMDASLVHGVPRSVWLDAYMPVAKILQDAKVTRLYTPDYSFPQQAAAYWNIPEFGGVDPFQSSAYVAAFEKATGTQATGYTVTLPPYDNADPHLSNRGAVIDPQQLADWDVSHVLTSFPLNIPELTLVQQIDGLYLYKNTLLPDVEIHWQNANEFTAMNRSTRPVNVAAWMPGWNTNSHNVTAIVVQPGQSLTASYEAPGLGVGLVISIVSLIVAGSAFVIGTRRG